MKANSTIVKLHVNRNKLRKLFLLLPFLSVSLPAVSVTDLSVDSQPAVGFSSIEGAPTKTNFTPESRASMQRLYHDKVGLFIHWGPYAVLGGMYQGKRSAGEWIMNRAEIPVKTYEEIAARKIDLSGFNADEWAQLVQDAGMGFVVVTAKHHDGFAMFDSKVSNYDITDFAGTHRDPMKELAEAVQKKNINMGFYYSQTQDWHESGGIGNTWDFNKPSKAAFSQYLNNKAIPQVEELVKNYGDLAMLWFDTPGPIESSDAAKLIKAVNSNQPQVLMNSRIGGGHGHFESAKDHGFPPGVYQDPKNLIESIKIPWQTHTSIPNIWGYTTWSKIKPTAAYIDNLVQVVSKGGVLLLNIAPDGHGNIPDEQVNVLREFGQWLSANGEAIYNADPSPFVHHEYPMTIKGTQLYIFLEKPNAKDDFILNGLLTSVDKAFILSDTKRNALAFTQQGRNLSVKLPSALKNEAKTVLVLSLSEAMVSISDQTIQAKHDLLTLPVRLSNINSLRFGYEQKTDSSFHWSSKGQTMNWTVNITKPGRYQLTSLQAADDSRAGFVYTISNGEQMITTKSLATGSRRSFVDVDLGVMNFAKAGHYVVSVELTKPLPATILRVNRQDRFKLRALKFNLLSKH